MSNKIYLYNEIPDLDLERLSTYIRAKCPFAELELRGNFISHFFSDELIKDLAEIWQPELSEERTDAQIESKRLEYEESAYLRPEEISPSVVYDGLEFLELLQSQIPPREAGLDRLHIFLTPRLAVTRDDMDRRWHARTILSWQPSVISSSGLVEAPARSMEYYIFRTGYQTQGQAIPESVMKKRFEGQFLDYHDRRLTEVIKGYILQGIAYRFFGEGFCDEPHCRLFNAHRQHEMLKAQLEPPEFCSHHQSLFS